MPSTVDPSTIASGPGKLHVDVANAAADLFANISSSLLASLSSVLTHPLAAPTVLAGFTGSNNTSVLLSSANGPYYVGDSGADVLADLFKIVRADNDAEIFNKVANDYVVVTSISPATIGSGFTAGNLTLNFNVAIPTGLAYKVVYGKRVTVSNLPVELASNPVIRRSPDRVRFPEVARTGLAPTSVATPVDIVTGDYLDPYMAQWKAVLRGPAASFYNVDFGGSIGFVNVGPKKNINNVNDSTPQGSQAAAFLAVQEKNLLGTGSIAGILPSTRVNAANTATLNPGGALPNGIELAATDYFRTATETAVRLALDMLEVTFSNGDKEVYIITTLDSGNARRAELASLGGGTPSFTTNTAVTAKWVRPVFFVGGDNEGTTGAFNFRGMFSGTPSSISNTPDGEIEQYPAFFSSGVSPALANLWGQQSLAWGYFSQSTSEGISAVNLGAKTRKGELWGDGSVHSFGGRISGMHSGRIETHVISSSQTVTWNPQTSSFLSCTFSGSVARVLTLVLDPAFTVSGQFADEIYVHISSASVTAESAGEQSTVVWPASFKFSGNDADVTGPATRDMFFKGVCVNGTFFMTRTDYE